MHFGPLFFMLSRYFVRKRNFFDVKTLFYRLIEITSLLLRHERR